MKEITTIVELLRARTDRQPTDELYKFLPENATGQDASPSSHSPPSPITDAVQRPAPDFVDGFARGAETTRPDATSPLVEQAKQHIEMFFGCLQTKLENNALSRAAGRATMIWLAPLIDALGRRVDQVLNAVGRGADRLADRIRGPQDAHGLVARLRMGSADLLSRVVGRNSLRGTSLLLSAGVRLNIPGLNLNGGIWANQYFPSVALMQTKGSYAKAMYTNYGCDVESPIGAVGWGRRGRASAVLNLYFVSTFYDEKQEAVFLGIPGLLGVTFGRDLERGSYTTFTNSVPLTPLWIFGPMLTTVVEVYSPLIEPVNKYVTRPIAQRIRALVCASTRGIDAVRNKLGRAPHP
jgi:hypothetical protein